MWTVWRLCGICLDRRGAEAIVWQIEDRYDRSVMSIFFFIGNCDSANHSGRMRSIFL